MTPLPNTHPEGFNTGIFRMNVTGVDENFPIYAYDGQHEKWAWSHLFMPLTDPATLCCHRTNLAMVVPKGPDKGKLLARIFLCGRPRPEPASHSEPPEWVPWSANYSAANASAAKAEFDALDEEGKYQYLVEKYSERRQLLYAGANYSWVDQRALPSWARPVGNASVLLGGDGDPILPPSVLFPSRYGPEAQERIWDLWQPRGSERELPSDAWYLDEDNRLRSAGLNLTLLQEARKVHQSEDGIWRLNDHRRSPRETSDSPTLRDPLGQSFPSDDPMGRSLPEDEPAAEWFTPAEAKPPRPLRAWDLERTAWWRTCHGDLTYEEVTGLHPDDPDWPWTDDRRLSPQEEKPRARRAVTDGPIPMKPNVPPSRTYWVQAWDCGNPQGVHLVKTPQDDEQCLQDHAEVTATRSVQYLVLQRATLGYTEVIHCSVRRSVVTAGCGMYDHQWLLHQFNTFDEVELITPQKCLEIVQSGYYTDEVNTRHKIIMGAPNSISTMAIGDVTLNGKCSTGFIRDANGDKVHKILRSYHRNILVQKLKATVTDNGEIHVLRPDVTLPCRLETKSCTTATGTYVWDTDVSKQCRFYKTRKDPVNGTLTQDSEGEQTFLSTDGSLIRLIMKKPAIACGELVHATNYEKLFLTEALNHPAYDHELPVSEVSTLTYVNQQDDYLRHDARENVQREIRAIKRQECKMRIAKGAVDLTRLSAAQSASSSNLDAINLGAGYFASAAGDAYYKFRCRPVRAKAVEKKVCYAGLPVILQEGDLQRYNQARGLAADHVPELFVGAKNHLLTDVGIKIPCVRQLAPVFRGEHDQWIRASPELSISIEPSTLEVTPDDVDGKPSADTWDELDMEAGGIYGKETVLSLESRLQSHRASEDVAWSMVQTAREQDWKSSLRPHLAVTDITDGTFPSFGAIFWSNLIYWSQIFGVIYMFEFSFRVFLWATSSALRIYGPRFHERASAVKHWLAGLWPALRHAFMTKAKYRPVPRPESPIEVPPQLGAGLEALELRNRPPSAPAPPGQKVAIVDQSTLQGLAAVDPHRYLCMDTLPRHVPRRHPGDDLPAPPFSQGAPAEQDDQGEDEPAYLAPRVLGPVSAPTTPALRTRPAISPKPTAASAAGTPRPQRNVTFGTIVARDEEWVRPTDIKALQTHQNQGARPKANSLVRGQAPLATPEQDPGEVPPAMGPVKCYPDLNQELKSLVSDVEARASALSGADVPGLPPFGQQTNPAGPREELPRTLRPPFNDAELLQKLQDCKAQAENSRGDPPPSDAGSIASEQPSGGQERGDHASPPGGDV